MADRVSAVLLAIHEGGHAAAVVSLGYSIDSVRLEPPEVNARFGHNAWRHQLTVACAGDAATRRAGFDDRARSDEDDALRIINATGGGSWELVFARHRAEALIDWEWPKVERLAAALLDRRLLLGPDVRRLMAGGAVDEEVLFLLRLSLAARAA